MGSVQAVAFVDDLLDRSKLEAALPGVRFARAVGEAVGARVVVVDLSRHRDLVVELHATVPDARIVCYGRHTDSGALEQALRDGASAAVARSRFFRDPVSLTRGGAGETAQTRGQG